MHIFLTPHSSERQCVVTWTKIKTVPIKIIIDEMQLKLEVTGNPTERDFVELDPELYGYAATDGPVKAEKYGFVDGVTDGVQIDIQCIDVTVVAPEFLGTVHIIHVSLRSCDGDWKPVDDLRKSKIRDEAKKTLTLFKLLTIHELRGVISPMTSKIAEAAQSDPFTFNISQPRLRIFTRKSLLDNRKVHSMHMTLDISLIRQELSRFQIQTINHMVISTSRMIAETRGMKFHQLPEVEGGESASMADHGFHIKIKKLEIWLKNHRQCGMGGKQEAPYLTSLLMDTVTIHHFAEQPMGAQLRSKNALRQAYLSECGAWTKSVNSKWARSVKLSKRERARLRQAATSVTIEGVRIITRRAASAKEQVNQKRGSKPSTRGSDSSIGSRRLSQEAALLEQQLASEPSAADDKTLVELLQSNYAEYHLPRDLALVQLDMVSYFVVDSAILSPGHQGPRSPDTRREHPLPAPIMYCRVNPMKVQVNLSAMLQFVDFAHSCSICTPVFSSVNTPQSVVDLGTQISLCTTQARLALLLRDIDAISDSTAELVTPDDVKELRRVHSVRMEQLDTTVAIGEAEVEEEAFQRFSIELSLPTLVLPNRTDGPPRVKELELRLICSKATITNCMHDMHNSQHPASLEFDEFYESPLVTQKGEEMTEVDVKVMSDGRRVNPLPDRTWLPTATHVHSASTIHMSIDQMWGDLYTNGTKSTMMRPTTMSIWMFDSTKHVEELEEMNESRIKSSGIEIDDLACAKSSDYAASYTMVSFPQQLQLDINNSVYLFLMRFLDEFSRLNALLDDGNEMPQAFTFICINDISLSLFSEDHMLENVSERRASSMKKAKHGEPFHHLHIRKLHNVLYSGKREGVSVLAIGGVEFDSRKSFKLDNDSTVKHEWADIVLALRMESSIPEPEHSYMYYQQLDQAGLYKEALAVESLSPTATSALSQAILDQNESPTRINAVNSDKPVAGMADVDSNESLTSNGVVSNNRDVNPLSISATMAATDPLGAVTGTPIVATESAGLVVTPETDFEEVSISSTPLGQSDPRLTSTPMGRKSLTSSMGRGSHLLVETMKSGTMTSIRAANASSAIQAFKLNENSFTLKHLPTPRMRIGIQNLDLKLDSDDLALFLALLEDYYPDDLVPESEFDMSILNTKIILTDVKILELKLLEAWRLISPQDTATQSFQLNQVSVKKTGNKFLVENGAQSSIQWDPEKEAQRKTISELQAELEAAKVEIAAQRKALEVAEGRLRNAERVQAVSLEALAQSSQS